MTREFDARSTRYGRFFDEFEIGDFYNHWPGKTITESESCKTNSIIDFGNL